jgi:hypothetical protein
VITRRTLFPQGLIPRRILLGGVSDPAGRRSAGYQTCRTRICYKIYTSLSLFCGVWYPASLGSAGSDTPQDLVLRGLIPRWILFCGVSDPTGKLRPRRIRQKRFKSLPFSLKGHFSKIVCMYKLHYPRLIVSMLKESPILKIVFYSAGYDTQRNHFQIRISRRIRNRNQKYFGAWIRGPYGIDSWNKPEAEKLVLLYL